MNDTDRSSYTRWRDLPRNKRRQGPNPNCWHCGGTGQLRAHNARKTIKCGECALKPRTQVLTVG